MLNERLLAIRPDGTWKWAFPVGGFNSDNSPAIGDDGTVHIGSSNGILYAVNPDGTLRWTIVTVRQAGAAIVVPVMEELFWRSFVMRWVENQRFLEVDPKRVGILALGLTSAAFVLEHDLWFAGLLAGLGYGWLYTRTGNLWAPVVSHAVTNALLGAWVP